MQLGSRSLRLPERIQRLQECLLPRVIGTAVAVELLQPPAQTPELARHHDRREALQEFFRAEIVQTTYLPGTLALS